MEPEAAFCGPAQYHCSVRVAPALILLLIFLVTLWTLASCDGNSPSAALQPDDASHVRIVSLSPAISRTLVDLQLDHLIVGRTPFCDSLSRSVPIVGDLYDLNWEALVRVSPTHVLVQPPASGVSSALVREASARNWTLASWHIDDVDDILTLLRDLPETLFSDGRSELLRETTGRASELTQKIRASLSPRGDVFTGSVLLLIGLDPVTAFGEGTYLHDLLLALGGRNAITVRGYPQLTFEDLVRLKPEAVILVQPGGSPDAVRTDQLNRFDIPAVKADRVAVLTHPDALLPSSAVASVADELAVILESVARAEQETAAR